MNIRQIIIVLLGFFVLIFTNQLLVDTRVDKQELKELITGKTLEGKWITWNTT